MKDPFMYRSIIGDLPYVILTRPYISYCVNKACYIMNNPLENHWSVLKRIIIYLSGNSTHCLLISPTNTLNKFSLRAYNDFPVDPDDRRSTLSSCTYFGLNLISWSSKK